MANPKFSGEPQTQWLTEKGGPDRNMKLLEQFWFDDGRGTTWDAPEGSIIDGASIPKPLWGLVGSPFTGDYRRASIVHDIACVAAVGDPAARKAADKMFFRACREGGCGIREAIILYIGVRIGAQWDSKMLQAEQDTVLVRETVVGESVRHDFEELADDVLAQGEVDDADVIEKRVDDSVLRLHARKALISEKSLL